MIAGRSLHHPARRQGHTLHWEFPAEVIDQDRVQCAKLCLAPQILARAITSESSEREVVVRLARNRRLVEGPRAPRPEFRACDSGIVREAHDHWASFICGLTEHGL